MYVCIHYLCDEVLLGLYLTYVFSQLNSAANNLCLFAAFSESETYPSKFCINDAKQKPFVTLILLEMRVYAYRSVALISAEEIATKYA